MIDFTNGVIAKLSQDRYREFQDIIDPILVDGEAALLTYKGIRDGVVFTSKRIIAINVQGMTGKKVDISSLPYSRIQAYSTETAGTFDLDSELELWFSGLGKVKLEFTRNTNIAALCKLIGEKIL